MPPTVDPALPAPPPPAGGFASDNTSGAHPDVLAALVDANEGPAPAYGDDPWSHRLTAQVRDLTGADVAVLPTYGGTGANVTALSALLDGWGSVLCSEAAHIHVDECGAPERLTGAKVVAVPTDDGKLVPEAVDEQLEALGVVHHSQPQVLSLTQSTEDGTCYSLDELAALCDLAHRRGLTVHVDGARLANAAAHLDVGLAALTTDVGVDVTCLGGTKNGMVFGEALVTARPEVAERLAFARKQAGQLPSKARFVAAQLGALLTDDLWRRNGAHANAMARRLADAVERSGVALVRPPQTNAVFAHLPDPAIEVLAAWSPVYRWRPGVVRCVCSFDTTPDDVDRFAAGVAWASARSA